MLKNFWKQMFKHLEDTTKLIGQPPRIFLSIRERALHPYIYQILGYWHAISIEIKKR